MKSRFFIVDSFTSTPFKGNPAGVVILKDEKPADWMKNVAAEINLSETAFLSRDSEGYQIRWFTPEVEVELCGHATLASAHILWEQKILNDQEAVGFQSQSGLLPVKKCGDWIEMEFPLFDVEEIACDDEMFQMLSGSPIHTSISDSNLMVLFENPSDIHTFSPNFDWMRKLPYQGVIITSRSDDPDYDFISRYFAPKVGIPEDPVTGSAHCSLAPFWSERLGKRTLSACQVSKRGGNLRLRVEHNRVFIQGQAKTILKGELLPS